MTEKGWRFASFFFALLSCSGLIAALFVGACGTHSPGGMTGPSINNKLGETPRHPLESDEVLQRSEKTGEATVKHILIAWDSLDSSYEGEMDARAKKRSSKDAVAFIKSLLGKLDAGAVFEAIMIEHSEDPGSASTGKPYLVHTDAPFEKRFIKLSLRLARGEWGVVRSRYGFHIVKRVK